MKKTVYFLLLIVMLSGFSVLAETSPFCSLAPDALSSPSFLLMEAETGEIIIEQNADKKMPMASITKLMVLLIADEYISEGKLSLTDTITGTLTAKETPGSRVYLDEGEKMSLEDILKCISIPSANDAAVALAEHIAGNEEAFVKLMNQRAEKMGLKNTHYVTASGLDAEGHYSTARDIAKLSREILLYHPMIMSHARIKDGTIRDGKFPLINTNSLLSNYEFATGLKTGTTENAGYCLTATAEKNGTKLIAVILGAESGTQRFSEAKKLFEYAYDEFEMITLHQKGILKNDDGELIYATVDRGNKSKVALCAEKDIVAYIPEKYANKLNMEIKVDDNLTAPIEKGTVVGKINIYADGILVESQDVVTEEKVKKMNVFQAFMHVFRAWLSF